MVFSSLFFLYAFLPACLLAYMLCKSLRAKNICLLIFSLIFYAWGEPKFVLLLMGMALADWFFALRIENGHRKEKKAKIWLFLACVVDLGLILFFKYGKMISSFFPAPPAFIQNIALPIGISFYTFQLLTYVVDVYRGEAAAQKEYWHVLLYAALFHQCIAGPIVRYQSIADELFVERDAFADLPDGVTRFTVGLAKKVMLANPCGNLADKFLLADSVAADASLLTANMTHFSSLSVLGSWLGIMAFSLQIYFDFSAYSDMAIGMGKMLGLHYRENFNYPYISSSVTEFWRRWHISLGSFFRDYVYIPLGGNRKGTGRMVLNMLIVWALTGLWHGASWNFVLWGLYFFVFLVMERLFLLKVFSKLGLFGKILSHLYLLFAVILGWVLFKYSDMRYALTVLKALFGANGNAVSDFASVAELKGHIFFLAFCFIAATPLFRNFMNRWKKLGETKAFLRRSYCAVAYGILPVCLLALSTAGLVGNSYNPFLYFKF